PSPAPSAAVAMSAAEQTPPAADFRGRIGGPASLVPAPQPVVVLPVNRDALPWQNGRGGRWMRRVWVRHGTIGLDVTRDGDLARIQAARQDLEAAPDSRGRYQELYRRLAEAGQFAEAGAIAARWSARDALDPDALVRLSDVAAELGRRDQAIRILAGV